MREARQLGWARAALGALILLRTTPLLWPFDTSFLRETWPLLGWPDGGWTVSCLPEVVAALLCVARTLGALAFTVGIQTRAAGLVCGLSGLAIVAGDPFQFVFTLVLLYLGAIVLALGDAGAAFAVLPVPSKNPESSRWLLRMFLASIYFWAAVYKLRPDWLDGRTLAVLHRPDALHGPIADFVLATAWRRALVAKVVAGLELCLGPLLLARPTRYWALLAAFAFHVGLQLAASPDFLGFGMVALLVGCWEPSATAVRAGRAGRASRASRASRARS